MPPQVVLQFIFILILQVTIYFFTIVYRFQLIPTKTQNFPRSLFSLPQFEQNTLLLLSHIHLSLYSLWLIFYIYRLLYYN